MFVTSYPELLSTDYHFAPICREQRLTTSVRDSKHVRLRALQSIFCCNNETPITLLNVHQVHKCDKIVLCMAKKNRGAVDEWWFVPNGCYVQSIDNIITAQYDWDSDRFTFFSRIMKPFLHDIVMFNEMRRKILLTELETVYQTALRVAGVQRDVRGGFDEQWTTGSWTYGRRYQPVGDQCAAG